MTIDDGERRPQAQFAQSIVLPTGFEPALPP
jgi:hypothetical protein